MTPLLCAAASASATSTHDADELGDASSAASGAGWRLERHAREELHHEEERAVLGLPDVDDLDDVRVVDARADLRLERKRRAASGVRATCGSMNLIANSRSVKTLVADHTEAIPPVPRRRFRRYLPAIVWPELIITGHPPNTSVLARASLAYMSPSTAPTKSGLPSRWSSLRRSQVYVRSRNSRRRWQGTARRRRFRRDGRSGRAGSFVHDFAQESSFLMIALAKRVSTKPGAMALTRILDDAELERERLGHRDDGGLGRAVDAPGAARPRARRRWRR